MIHPNELLHPVEVIGNLCLDLIFPRRCPVCGEIVGAPGALVCPGCVKELSPVKQPSCKRCGKEVLSDRQEYCLDCSRRGHAFESGMALLNYNEAARKSMADIKYKNRREYLDFYAQAMNMRFHKQVARIAPDALVPVPIHVSRRRQRGFNQAEELALRLGKLWDLPVERNLLVRKRRTDPQKELNPGERLRNLRDAFALSQGQRRGIPRAALLVDDIYTTGSTVEACARILKMAGVERVDMIVICIGSGVG